jgi:hypothetical protein
MFGRDAIRRRSSSAAGAKRCLLQRLKLDRRIRQLLLPRICPPGDQHFGEPDVLGEGIAEADSACRYEPPIGRQVEKDEGAVTEIAPHRSLALVDKPAICSVCPAASRRSSG